MGWKKVRGKGELSLFFPEKGEKNPTETQETAFEVRV